VGEGVLMFNKIMNAIQAAANNNTNNNKEDNTMTAKERWMMNLKKGQDLGYEAAHKTGYGIGYATTTVKAEVSYAARKVAKAVSETRVAQEVRDGYYDGKNDAMTAFDCRVAEREFKAEQKKNAKANLEAAVDEIVEDFVNAVEYMGEIDDVEEFDDSVCGDGVWNAQ
jgi:hypothetical protein